MKKFLAFLSVMFISILVLSGCGKGNTASSKKASHTVALVTDGGGIDDKSFQQSAWEGLQAWARVITSKKASMDTTMHNLHLIKILGLTLTN